MYCIPSGMVIRSAQISVLAESQFDQALRRYLRKELDSCPIPVDGATTVNLASLPEQTLAAIVRIGIYKARSYGIRSQATIAAFTALMCRFGPYFDEHPLVHRELAHPDVPDDARLDHLCAVLPDTVWERVKQSYGAADWATAIAHMEQE